MLQEQFDIAKASYDRLMFAPYLFEGLFQRDGHDLAWQIRPLRTLLVAYEATGEVKYLIRAQGYVEAILANRSDKWGMIDAGFGAVVPGWYSIWASGGRTVPPQTYVNDTGHITGALLKFAYLVKSVSDLYATRKSIVNRCIKSSAEALDLWDEHFIVGPADGEAHIGAHHQPDYPMPINVMAALARAYLFLSLATGSIPHRDRATRLARFTIRRMKRVDDHLEWNYSPSERVNHEQYTADKNPVPTPIEDTTHMVVTMEFLIECWRAGIKLVTDEIMAGLAKTYTNCLDVDGNGDDRFSHDVDGSGLATGIKPLQASRIAWFHPKLNERLRELDVPKEADRLDRDSHLMATASKPIKFV
ncbi:hypothetical protein LCGC14_0236080 [marine sediment metagenome]|uniref:Alpha-L-rhamnosidase six-hairpin glycosidase domain-containing protein n=1 Tax=marine sediment metagenome TaxID=412755 RepID=A0A0F9UQK1_9ZZZZ